MVLWSRFPGRWIVRVSEGNKGALPYGAVTERGWPGNPHPWRVFSFASLVVGSS